MRIRDISLLIRYEGLKAVGMSYRHAGQMELIGGELQIDWVRVGERGINSTRLSEGVRKRVVYIEDRSPL
jgi:hypothetical protein